MNLTMLIGLLIGALIVLTELNNWRKDKADIKNGVALTEPRFDGVLLIFILLFAIYSLGYPKSTLDDVVWFVFAYAIANFIWLKMKKRKGGLEFVVLTSAILLGRTFVIAPFYTPTESMLPTIGIERTSPYIVDKLAYGIVNPMGGYFTQWDTPKRGDVVIFDHKQEDGEVVPYVKRVIGLPGDLMHYDYHNKEFMVVPDVKDIARIEPTIEVKEGNVYGNGMQVRTETYGGVTYDTLIDPAIKFLPFEAEGNPYIGIYKGRSVDGLSTWRIPEGEIFVMGDNRDWSYDSRFFGTVNIADVKGKMIWSKGLAKPEEVKDKNVLSDASTERRQLEIKMQDIIEKMIEVQGEEFQDRGWDELQKLQREAKQEVRAIN